MASAYVLLTFINTILSIGAPEFKLTGDGARNSVPVPIPINVFPNPTFQFTLITEVDNEK